MGAAFVSDAMSMARPQTTPLRETASAAPIDRARVIEARFSVVKGGKRSWWARLLRWMLAFAVAALVGFAIPIVWTIVREIAAMFGG